MTYEVLQKAEKYNNKNRKGRKLKKILGILSCLVVVVTMGLLMLPAQTEGDILLRTYLQENGGDYELVLTDAEDNEITMNEAEEYIVSVEDEYNLSMDIISPVKIEPGTYIYQFPEELIIAEETGDLIINDDEELKAGTWTVDENGLAAFVFDEIADEYPEMIITAVMNVKFAESEIPVDFDGKMTVAVEKPVDEDLIKEPVLEADEKDGSGSPDDGTSPDGDESEGMIPEGQSLDGSEPGEEGSEEFTKELTKEFDGTSAQYTLTVNEEKKQLSNGIPLTIHDVMSTDISYIAGTLAVNAEDADGNIIPLKEDEDFILSYDGTGECIEEGEFVNVLDIVIKNPQPFKYIITYETSQTVSGDIEAPVSYRVSIAKTDADTGEPLAGAVFGLYSAENGLIDSRTTDENGNASFGAAAAEGIILNEHVMYYLQEIEAPDGYILLEDRQWIVFCSGEDGCEECTGIISGSEADVTRITDGSPAVSIENKQGGYKLPETGGSGTALYYMAGLMLICMAGGLLTLNHFKRRRKT